MAEVDQERLKNYVALLKRAHGGDLEQHIKQARQTRLENAPGLESVERTSEAEQGLHKAEAGGDLSGGEAFGLEAIINEDLRPAIDIVKGTFQVTHPLWTKLSSNPETKKRIEKVIPSVGCIGLPGNRRYPYAGTGFVVGKGLLMTNRHVAEIFTRGLGTKKLDFLPDARADVDFLREVDGPPNPKTLEVSKTLMVHPYWDMAILQVEGLNDDHPILELSLDDARQLAEGREIFVIGYPAFDPRNPADVQQKLFEGTYGVKRLQPGALHGSVQASSFGKSVAAASHDCSTLGGNSGSALFDLASGQVLGLHFGGQYHRENYAVPAYELSRDNRVVDAGVKFFGDRAAGGPGDWANWWARADQTELTSSEADVAPRNQQSVAAKLTSGLQRTIISDGSVRIEVPLVVTISLGKAAGAIGAETAATETLAEDLTEAMKEPFRDKSYEGRSGYDPRFLNGGAPGEITLHIPPPFAIDGNVLARTQDGEEILKYEHFSIAMHEKRRIALFTSSNVVATPELKKPESGKDYSRRGLSGLGPNDQEHWFLDPRIAPRDQLPDVFFSKDRQAFDKGHIVRREDVAWGRTYEELRRANGDTYHVTNCSPQVKEFNRSNLGEANWGDLENHVLSESASERLCVFAGPVLTDEDRIFRGTGDGGKELRARIPEKFWKIIVARTEQGCGAFGFVLEQDLSDVEWEFTVSDAFQPSMFPITGISEMTGVGFPSVVLDNDQYDTTRGTDVALRSGAKRKRRKKKS